MMNEMGVWQRSWCILVTCILLVALSLIYTKAERETDRELALSPVKPSTAVKAISNTNSNPNPASVSAVYSSGGRNPQIRLVRATVFSHQSPEDRTASGASGEGALRNKNKPANSGGNKASGTSGHKAKSSGASKVPASIPVAAPGPEQIIRTLKVMATGYTAGFESTGKRPDHPEYGITYSGVKVRRDKNAVSTIAADPKVLPLGSILYVPGYGYAVVADTGSAIKGHKIDLYFATIRQVYGEWGKKSVEVQLIKRGNGKCTEAMLKSIGGAIRAYDTVPQEMLEEIV